jgi:hypothetical protein
MTRKEQLTALAERVEGLSGPDREVDRDIADALGLGPPADWQREPARFPNGAINLDVGCWTSPRGGFIRSSARYTASLDAAMSPTGDWFIAQMGDLVADGMPGVCLCTSTDPLKHVWGTSCGDDSHTARLARAYTAAALRARAIAEGEQ